MSATYRFEGHAIVSADDRIADRDGAMPPALRNDADWRRFQAALDAAAVTVLGRRSHEAVPNLKRRNRVVMSSAARGLERRTDAWWWSPAEASLDEALAAAAPAGGTVAVPGGRLVFDYFLALGFDAFHLARVADVTLAGGIPVFSAVAGSASAKGVLTAAGLKPTPPETLAANVTLTVWRRAA